MVGIGNKNHVSFEFRENNSSKELLNLHFYLGSKLISDESIYLPTYILSLQNLLDNLRKEQFENTKFEELPSEQCFKMLLKERDSDKPQFFKHLFQLDETIDQYTIFIFQRNETVRFVWICWDENNCNSDHELNMIYTVQFQIKELISTVNKLMKKLD